MKKLNAATKSTVVHAHEDETTLGANVVRVTRTVIAGIAALISGAGIASLCGWVVEGLAAIAVVAGMGVFAMNAICIIGLVLTCIAVFVGVYKTWDLVASGRAEEALSEGFTRVRGWFKRAEDEVVAPLKNGKAGPARMAH